MQVLVVGATGLIGSAIVARLIGTGCQVVGIARRTAAAAKSFPSVQWIMLDIAAMKRPEAWLPHLTGIDAVVNCAGVLQDSPSESTRAVHVDAIAALFAACEHAAGVRRVVHFSAIRIDREAPTPFSQSKIEGERALMSRKLDWVILRPSVVVGSAAYGGSALFRGLAALPLLPVMPDTGLLQPVQLDDVVETVLLCLGSTMPPCVVLELAGPDQLSLVEIVRCYRHWLGWGEPRLLLLRLPRWAAALLYRLGDFAGWLGWRPPIRSTAGREMARGAVGEPSAWTRVTEISPKSLSAALASHPASVQERWFSRLYFLKPLVFVILSLFWVVTGLIALGPAIGPVSNCCRRAALTRWARIRDCGRAGRHCDRCRHRSARHRARGALCRDRHFGLLSDRGDGNDAMAVAGPPWSLPQDRTDPRADLCCIGDPGGSLMLYYVLKWLHLIGAAVLLGTGAGIAFFMLMAHMTQSPATIAAVARMVVIADFLFTATAVVAQPITGIALVKDVGYSLTDGWVSLSIMLYLFAGAFWLPVVWMQIRMRDLATAAAQSGEALPRPYYRLFYTWFGFGFPAFGAVLAIFWLMITRPTLPLLLFG